MEWRRLGRWRWWRRWQRWVPLVSGGRALGTGLLSGAGVLALLVLVWLAVSGASSGGIVLGLILLAVLAGPLAFAGWYVLSRQPAEQRAAELFSIQRSVLDADRAFRREIGSALRSLAERPELPAARMLELARDLEAPVSVEDMVQLDAPMTETLRRYDDLVWQRVRRMRDGVAPGEADAVLAELRHALEQREDLLLRGRQVSPVEAGAILRSERPATNTANITQVDVGWAVSRGADDYVVEGVASYFAEGRTWRLAHLVPTSSEPKPCWLYVGPAATELALLGETSVPAAAELPLVSSGSAVADVSGGLGTAQGVLVDYQRHAAGEKLAFVEQWPNGDVRAYVGQTISAGDIELWPAAPTS